ncbi:GtrA family protein [Rhodopseudomonas sp. P2A-2r]|uniref:GtrA family protein n=1 Tax=Rhodopseudomonas sp. P2A-2r TaxID=2991972 RepID=UPI002234A387|nr:GtrA family protein [Rhodopseudomonas sp. P2A-2r]UZE48074.1 GtrA family protein [Rhodopseudomonas sp. P2A-2r]
MKLLLPQFVENRLSHPMVAKMVSFGIIGLGNTVIDLAIFSLAYKVLGLPLVPANVLAWMVAVSGSYVMNTMITFRAESGRVLRRKDYVSFVASGILGVIATTTTLVVLSNFMPVLYAKLASILAGFVVNFTMSHFVVFRTKLPAEPRL